MQVACFSHKDGIVLRPQYFVFKLYANLMEDTVLSVWKEDAPTFTGTVTLDPHAVNMIELR